MTVSAAIINSAREKMFWKTVVCFLCLCMTAWAQQCSVSPFSLPPTWPVCASEPFSSSSFAGDPELRTYDGVEVVVFTGVVSPLPHIYAATRFPGSSCFGNITQLTFDEASINGTDCFNEVATHFRNGSVIWLYYNHYCRPTSGGYDPTTFSLRAKMGTFNKTASPTIVFEPEVGNVNTWVIWANSNSPEYAQALQSPESLGSTCFPPTEPTVFFDGLSTITMVFGCVDYSRLPSTTWQARALTANNPLFLSFTPFVTLVSSTATFCGLGSPPISSAGFQSPAILRFDGQTYLSISPIETSTSYLGCVLFPLNNATQPVPLNPSGAFMFNMPHSGSCSGGDGSLLPEDVATSRSVLFFYATSPSSSYTLQQTSFDQRQQFVFPTPTSAPTALPTSSPTPTPTAVFTISSSSPTPTTTAIFTISYPTPTSTPTTISSSTSPPTTTPNPNSAGSRLVLSWLNFVLFALYLCYF